MNNYKDWSAYVVGDEPRDKIIFNHKRLIKFGFIEHKKVINIYKKTSIRCLFKWENYLKNWLEATANGCAVIISDRGGLPETVTNGRILKNHRLKIFIKILRN